MDFDLPCNACHIFLAGDAHRDHYRTEWHRYNVKRKCANLAPVTIEVFEERVKTMSDATAVQEDSKSDFNCAHCRKKFSSKAAYDQHISTKKHKEVVAAEKGSEVSKSRSEPSTSSSSSSTQQQQQQKPTREEGEILATDAVPTKKVKRGDEQQEKEEEDETVIDAYLASAPRLKETDSLFDNQSFATFEEALDYVTQNHSFYIFDLEFVKDVKELYMYLADKISVGRTCLFCNRQFGTMDAVRAHMIDKGHTKLPYDDDSGELDQFYDYSSSYPEGMEPTSIEGIMTLAAAGAGGDNGFLPPGAVRKPVDIVDAGYTLVLSDGTTIGHRALRRIYKQNLVSYDNAREARERRRDDTKMLIEGLRQKYRLLGMGKEHSSNIGRSDVRKESHRRRQLWSMRNGQNGNRLQHYYRHQNPL